MGAESYGREPLMIERPPLHDLAPRVDRLKFQPPCVRPAQTGSARHGKCRLRERRLSARPDF